MPQFALLSARACGLRAAGGAAAADAAAGAAGAAGAAAGAAVAGAGVDAGIDAAGAVAGAGVPRGGAAADDAAVRGAKDPGGDAAVRPGADEPARRALAGCISDASPPVDHWGALDWVRTFAGGSSMGSSNCSDSESLDADTFEPDAGAGSGPHPESSAISAMKAPERRHPEHGPAAFMKGCRGGA